MLHHPTLEKLQQLRLSGMHKALVEQTGQSEIADLSFEQRLGLTVRMGRNIALACGDSAAREAGIQPDITSKGGLTAARGPEDTEGPGKGAFMLPILLPPKGLAQAIEDLARP